MLEDLKTAERWVDGWDDVLGERAARASTLSARLTALTGTAHDSDGLITVTVGASGTVTDLRLDENIRQQPAARTAQQILATIQAAQARLLANISNETARAYGQDSPLTESVIASYRERLGHHPAR